MSGRLLVHRTAIVVGLQNHREADRVVRLLVPESGRITALARSARSSTKRFGGALDIGNRLEVSLRPPKSAEGWWGLESATLEDGRVHTRADLSHLALVAYFTEVCGQLAREGHPEPKLFGLLDMALTVLDALTGPAGDVFRVGLETKALTFAGLAPSLAHCVACSTPLAAPVRLTPDGAAHDHCVDRGSTVTVAWLAAAEGARRRPLRESIDLLMPEGPAWAFAEAIEVHLGRRLRSRPVLATLTQTPPPQTAP